MAAKSASRPRDCKGIAACEHEFADARKAAKNGPPAKSGGAKATGREPVVYVTNHPLKYFAGRIGGDLIDICFPTPPMWTPLSGSRQTTSSARIKAPTM